MLTNNHRVEQIFKKTKTVCIGRFLIDVPENAEVVYGPTELPWPIALYPDQGDQMENFINKRLLEIESERRFARGALLEQDSFVGKVIEGIVPSQKIVFGVSQESGRIYRIDSYIKVKGDLFVQQADPIPAKKDVTVQGLKAVASALRPRSDSEVPSEPGVCIQAGFVSDSKGPGFEALSLGVRLTEFPDVHFSMSFTKKDKLVESDALEPRVRRAEEAANRAGQSAWYSRIKSLRRGLREVGNWKGFEILVRKPAQAAEEESHEFAFLSQGEPKNPLLPVLDVELFTGVKGNQTGDTKPSVTDEEAVEIWDKLIGSIRVRPTTTQQERSASNSSAALGMLARGGQCCPLSGWWECTDGGHAVQVQGGARQYFNEGRLMPNATLLGQPSLWQRIKHDQSRFSTENATVWILAGVDGPSLSSKTSQPEVAIAGEGLCPDPTVEDS